MNELKQTDLSKRLRAIVKNPEANSVNYLKQQLDSAADEIERYYNGMLNWKATAEAQSTQPEATKPAQDLGAAILALPLPETTLSARVAGFTHKVYGVQHMRDLLKAAAALASPADALVAGDRVDAELSKYLRHLPDCGSHVKEVDTYDQNDMWAGTVKVTRPCTCGLAAIQAQKDGQNEY